MFIIELYDRCGNKLQLGDIVMVSDGNRFNFYSEVTYLEKEQAIAPFHTFSFHSFLKVDAVPEGAIKSTEERYNIWFMRGDGESDKDADFASRYLIEWRACEHLIDKGYFRIKKQLS